VVLVCFFLWWGCFLFGGGGGFFLFLLVCVVLGVFFGVVFFSVWGWGVFFFFPYRNGVDADIRVSTSVPPCVRSFPRGRPSPLWSTHGS